MIIHKIKNIDPDKTLEEIRKIHYDAYESRTSGWLNSLSLQKNLGKTVYIYPYDNPDYYWSYEQPIESDIIIISLPEVNPYLLAMEKFQ